MKHVIKIIIAVIVFAVVILQNIFFHHGFFSILVGASVATVFYFSDSLLEIIATAKQNRERKLRLQQYIADFFAFCEKFGIVVADQRDLQHIGKDDLTFNRATIYSHLIEKCLKENYPHCTLKVIHILLLCNDVDRCNNDISKSELKKWVDLELDDFDMLNLDANSKSLLTAYWNYQNYKPLFEICHTADYNKLSLEFAKKYSQKLLSLLIFRNYEQSEEFRKTLSALLQGGKLNSLLLRMKIDQTTKEKLLTNNRKGLILLTNKFQRNADVEDRINMYPQLKVGRLTPQNFPESSKYLHMRLLYPKEPISPKIFLEQEILNNIPTEERFDGFAAIIPFETSEMYLYPNNKSQIENINSRKAYEAIDYFKTGNSDQVLNEAVLAKLSEIGINEILSIIPFNIFIPRVKNDMKLFIIDKYELFQSAFQIQSLFDWANINPQDLFNKFIELGCLEINSNEKDWIRIAKRIILEAKKHQEAANRAN